MMEVAFGSKRAQKRSVFGKFIKNCMRMEVVFGSKRGTRGFDKIIKKFEDRDGP